MELLSTDLYLKKLGSERQKEIEELMEIIWDFEYFSNNEVSVKVFYLHQRYGVDISNLHGYVFEYVCEILNKKKDYLAISNFLSNLDILLELFSLSFIESNIDLEYIEYLPSFYKSLWKSEFIKFIISISTSEKFTKDMLLNLLDNIDELSLVFSKLAKRDIIAIFNKFPDDFMNILTKLYQIFKLQSSIDFQKINYFLYVWKPDKYLDMILNFLKENHSRSILDKIYKSLLEEFRQDINNYFQVDVWKYFSKSKESIDPSQILKMKSSKKELEKYKKNIVDQSILISQISRKFQKDFDLNKSLELNIKLAFKSKAYKNLTIEQKMAIISKMKEFYNKAVLIKDLMCEYKWREKELLYLLLWKKVKWDLEIKQLNSSIIFVIKEDDDFILLHWNISKAVSASWFKTSKSSIELLKWSILVVRKDIEEYLLKTITHEYRHTINSIIFNDLDEKYKSIKDEIISYLAEGIDNNVLLGILIDPKWLYKFPLPETTKLVDIALKVKKEYPSIYLEILSIVNSKYWELFI